MILVIVNVSHMVLPDGIWCNLKIRETFDSCYTFIYNPKLCSWVIMTFKVQLNSISEQVYHAQVKKDEPITYIDY